MRIRHKLILPDGDRLPLYALCAAVVFLAAGVACIFLGVHARAGVKALDEHGRVETGEVVDTRTKTNRRGHTDTTTYYATVRYAAQAPEEFPVSASEYKLFSHPNTTVVVLVDPEDETRWVPEFHLPALYTRAYLVMLWPIGLAVGTVMLMMMGLWYQYWRKRPGTGAAGVAYGSSTPYTSSIRR